MEKIIVWLVFLFLLTGHAHAAPSQKILQKVGPKFTVKKSSYLGDVTVEHELRDPKTGEVLLRTTQAKKFLKGLVLKNEKQVFAYIDQYKDQINSLSHSPHLDKIREMFLQTLSKAQKKEFDKVWNAPIKRKVSKKMEVQSDDRVEVVKETGNYKYYPNVA